MRMLRLASPVLRLIAAPSAVAAVAAFKLWSAGPLIAVSVGWCVFVLCVFAVGAWGNIQLQRAERRVRSLRHQRSKSTR